MPLSYRFYLADAIFLAAVQGEHHLLEGLHEALLRPAFPLYLGRRACPPAGPVTLGLRDGDLTTVLQAEPWQASTWYRRQQNTGEVRLDLLRDAQDASEVGEVVRDEPLSFDPVRREYGWRTVVRDEPVTVPNPDGRRPRSGHEPMSLLGGG
jgi:CRISPR system Cascade subunit CasD